MERFSGSRRSLRDPLWLALLLSACPGPVQTGLPCDIAPIVSAKCLNCHGAPLKMDAPMKLVTHADFAAPSTLDPASSFAQRSQVRVHQTAAPMPPQHAPALTPDELAAFDAWVTAGAPAGACATDLDAGLPVDGGPPPLTCASTRFAPQPTTSAPNGGPGMAPGWACRACHSGQDFEGQNPGGVLGMTPVYDVMGTVYDGLHEEDRCISTAGDAGLVVEIRDSTGTLVISAQVGVAGNFYGSVAMDAGLKLPYTAKLTRGAASVSMMAAQMNSDCNQCHTEYGREGAAGRILPP